MISLTEEAMWVVDDIHHAKVLFENKHGVSPEVVIINRDTWNTLRAAIFPQAGTFLTFDPPPGSEIWGMELRLGDVDNVKVGIDKNGAWWS